MKRVLYLLLLFGLFGCARNSGQNEYITVGAVLPLTGEGANDGLLSANGLHIAKNIINENGGVLGKPLDLIILDDKGDNDIALAQYETLKNKNVAAVIGSSYSGVTNAIAERAAKDGIPLITPTASELSVTQGRPNVFRVIFTDDYQVRAMVKFALETLGAKTAVVLINETESNLAYMARVFSDAFTNAGGRVLAEVSYGETPDYAEILSRYADNPPDAFYCPEYYTNAARFINAAHEARLFNAKLLGQDAWDGILKYVHNEDAVENVYYTAPFSFDDENESIRKFVEYYYEEFTQIPLAAAASACAALQITARAIDKAGGVNWGDIASAIRQTEADTIMGKISFDENNNPKMDVYIIRTKNRVYYGVTKISVRELSL